jgi:hypothetical protein
MKEVILLCHASFCVSCVITAVCVVVGGY